jgi:predicted Zn-dependent protease
MKKILSRRDFIQYAGKIGLTGTSVYALASMLNGCVSADVASTLSQVAKYSDSAIKVGKAAIKAFDEFTPEQEYYIGRTVGAVVLEKYKPYDNKQVTHYINVLGQTLAHASDLPETFNGYHLLVLDTDDINAFATPSGLIFVSRGMLRCCNNEGELAAILAHEVGHVQLKHGLQAIKKGLFTEFGTILAMETTKTLTDSEMSQLVESFEGTISDITTTMINNGYSRSFEEDADESAVTIMNRVGYNPISLEKMLETMNTKLKPEGLDFAKTHPSPKSRIEYLEGIISTRKEPTFSETQEKRFQTAMKNV